MTAGEALHWLQGQKYSVFLVLRSFEIISTPYVAVWLLLLESFLSFIVTWAYRCLSSIGLHPYPSIQWRTGFCKYCTFNSLISFPFTFNSATTWTLTQTLHTFEIIVNRKLYPKTGLKYLQKISESFWEQLLQLVHREASFRIKQTRFLDFHFQYCIANHLWNLKITKFFLAFIVYYL